MLDTRKLHFFKRSEMLAIVGAGVDSEIIDGEEVDVLTFRVRDRNASGNHQKGASFQLPIDHPMSVMLLEMIRKGGAA